MQATPTEANGESKKFGGADRFAKEPMMYIIYNPFYKLQGFLRFRKHLRGIHELSPNEIVTGRVVLLPVASSSLFS